MRKLLLLVILLLPALCYSQRLTTKIKTAKIGALDCEFTMITEPGKDTTYSLNNKFQNQEFTAITDIGNLYVLNNKDLDSLIHNLEIITPYIKSGKTVSLSGIGYTFDVYDWAPDLALTTQGKFALLSKAQAVEWLKWLKSIELPK